MDLDTQGKTRDQEVRQAGDDQIGVITLMRLMWKWKIVILAGILVCALAALLISMLMPHVYDVDMLVENVQIGTGQEGKRVYLGDLKDLKGLIDVGAFNQDILASLREQYKDALPRRISFKVSLENNKQFAKIAYEAVDVEMGEKILSQLFKRLQETNLVRVEHWKKEIDSKIEEKRAEIPDIKAQIDKKKEEIVLAEKNEHSMKQEMLAKAKADKRAKEDTIKYLQKKINNVAMQRKIDMSDMKAEKSKKEDMIKRLQKEINSLAMKRKIDMSEKMSDMNAEKSMKGDTIKNIEKRNTEINSSIKLIKSEIDFLIKTRKELVSKRNETKNIGVAGELTSLIIDGYDQLAKLRQEVNHNNDLILQARHGIQKLDAGIRSLKDDTGVTPKEIKVLNDGIGQARLDIEELDAKIKALRDHAGVTSIEIKVINDRIRQARLDIEELESRAEKLSDELTMSSSTEKPNNYLEYTIPKARDNVALITEEIGALEANKKKVKNIVFLQPPTSGVSPLRPDTKRNVVIGAVVGLFLSLFLSVFLEYVYKREA